MNGTTCGRIFLGLGSCWSKDLLNGCRSLVVHRKTGTSLMLANLRMCPQTWTVCIRARTAASSSHQIVDCAVRMARVHGVRRPAPSYAGRDGICSSCKRGFHPRLRLAHHLSYSSPRCLEWCILHCEPMTDEDREVLDREDADQRRKDKREGRSFLATAVPFVLGS